MAGTVTTEAEVLLAAGGDRDAFERLIAATQTLVASIALSELRDVDAARDVAQDVYLQVWNDLHELRNPSSFLPFLRQVTRLRARRVAGRRDRELSGPAADNWLAEQVDPALDPGVTLLRSEESRAVRDALDALPDDTRETVALYYLEGHSAARVAHLLGLSVQAVHQRLSRARVRLRSDVLARLGDGLAQAAPGAAFTAAVLSALPSSATALGSSGAPVLPAAGLASATSSVAGKATLAGVALVTLAILAFVGAPTGSGGPSASSGNGGPSIARPHQPPTRHDDASSLETSPAADPEGLEVRVTAARTPAAGADVRLYRRIPVDAATGRPAWRAERSALTSSDGRVRFAVPAGAYLVTARASGFGRGQREVARPSGEPVTRVDVELSAPSTLSGRVTARPGGEPVPLAALSLEREPALSSGAADLPLEERYGAVADPNGRFSVPGLGPGRYRLVAEAAGHARAVVRQVVVPRQAPLDVVMGQAGVIEGTVLLPDGQPAAGAEVSFVGGPEVLTVTAGPRGGFAAEVVPGGYRVHAILGTATGAFPRPVPVAAGATARDVNFRLGSAAVLAGKVTGPSGAPVEGAQVLVSPHAEQGEMARALTTRDGAFEVGPLAPGAYDLDVQADGHSPAKRSALVVLAGQRFEIDVRLEGIGSLEGTVRDENGAPVSGARVRGGRMWASGLSAVPAEAVTGPDGRYLLPTLEVGVADVRAHRPGMKLSGSKPVVIEAGRRAVADFILPATGTVEGEVTFVGEHPRESPVVVQLVPEQPIMRARDLGRTEVDEEGRFRFELPPGPFRFIAGTLDRKATSEWIRAAVVAGKTTRIALVVKAGADDPTRVAVDVVEPGGAPAGEATVTLIQPGTSIMVQADGTGHATLRRQPGAATVSASKGGRLGLPVEVGPDSRTVTIELLPAAFLRGRVTDSGGGEVRGFTLLVESPSNEVPSLGRGDRRQFTGDRFELTDVRTGPVRVVATTSDGRVGETLLTLAPGDSVERDVAVQAAATLLVRPVGSDGRPLAGAYVILGSRMIDTATDGVYFDRKALQEGVVVVEGVGAGKQEVRVGARMHREVVRSLDLAPGQTLDLGTVALAPVETR